MKSTRRIVILGFMGCGKTTVGAALAGELNCKFVDLDSFILEREGRSPAQMLQEGAESDFRDVESLLLTEVLKDLETRIIALGGGTWTTPANRTLVALYDCSTVWLDAPFELCWDRITSSSTVRPLAPDRVSAKELYDIRRPIYQLGQLRIDASEKSPGQIVSEIEAALTG